MPILGNDAVVLDDSDEEDAKTDDSEDSEVEFELGEGETLEDIIAKEVILKNVTPETRAKVAEIAQHFKSRMKTLMSSKPVCIFILLLILFNE